jgi:hypothetical protein
MPFPPDELAEAQRLGRLEAERLDLAWRELEARQREERLGRLAWTIEAEDAAFAGGGGSIATAMRLQRDVERLAAFHQAVTKSRAWRLIQALRRLVGRAW